MSLDYNLTKVDREKWPDGGVNLFEFCCMMMLCGVNELKDEKSMETLKFRSFILDRVRDFGWEQNGIRALIPLMLGIRTNVTTHNDGKFMKEVIRLGRNAYDDAKEADVRRVVGDDATVTT